MNRLLRMGFLFGFLFLIGCQPATRYSREKPKPVKANLKSPPLLSHYGWMDPEESVPAIPIEFVADDSPEWESLPNFWNQSFTVPRFMKTFSLGNNPLSAIANLFTTNPDQKIRIKVPLGLEDPTPLIPLSNPPTLEKWRLGKLLFFDQTWLTDYEGIACTTCHDPDNGFTERQSPQKFRMNAPSVINSVYNRHQFWDGRADSLEEVLQRELSDEKKTYTDLSNPDHYAYRHIWGGIIPRLNKQPKFVAAFRRAFGVKQPTINAAARALATYMRTLLSGNSLYDRAFRASQKESGESGSLEVPIVQAKHFEPLLDEKTLVHLKRDGEDKSGIAAELSLGVRLFYSKKAKCYQCHSGSTFTDHQFHNISIRESNQVQMVGKEHGRFRTMPLGLRSKRMIGAYRTPTLRNLPRTFPYFHDGSVANLEDAVRFYRDGLKKYPENQYLDPVFQDEEGRVQALKLSDGEIRAICLFLQSLDGGVIAEVLTNVPDQVNR